MERYPILYGGKSCGELTMEREGLYVCFRAAGSMPDEMLWCVWAVGERKELRLGVLEPEQGRGVLRRRFSARETASLGQILRCELRRAGETAVVWTPVGDPAGLFHTEWLRRVLSGAQGALTCCQGRLRLLALPWEKRQPFPLVSMFCFASIRCIGGRSYAVYAFDDTERPVVQVCENREK